MASPNLSEIITTTLRNRTGKLADNVTKNNAILTKMKEAGSLKTVSGGRTIVQELEYAENSTYTRYSGYETLNIQPSDVFTAAEFDWKQLAVAVTISGLEGDVINTGEEAIIDLLASRIKNAEKTMANNMSGDMYSDGTASSSKQIGGLQLLVADDPTTGTVGGIARATWAFWQNQVWDCSSDGTGAASATLIQGYMNSLALKCIRGTDRPTLIMSANTYYGFYLASLQAIQRITDDKMAAAGFTSLKYYGPGMSADVVHDGSSTADSRGACPTDRMYFLNPEYIKYRPHKNRNMVPLEAVQSINQDATVKLIVWAGNMTLSNAFLQGVMKP
jgi:hypothetical protein